MKEKRFNVRAYGICQTSLGFLITDEIIDGTKMTKFVGGGLEWGEGLTDAVKREFLEECGAEVTRATHYYTTEHFQLSAFRPTDQLISVYFKVKVQSPLKIPVVNVPFQGLSDNQQCFRWVTPEKLNLAEFTFPIDKIVVSKLMDSL